MPEAIVKEGRVQLRDAQGGAFSVPENEAAAQLATGEFRLEQPDEFEHRQMVAERETLGQQALTTGEGAVRGATLGLGTAALAELGGDEYRQAALERQQVNPGLAVAGEVGGAILPGLLSGGAGTAGSLARLAPVSLIGRAGAVAEGLAGRAALGIGESAGAQIARGAIKLGTAGAVEGAAYGLGSSLADSALEGTEWTAERALSGLKSGALYGLAGGALLGGGQKAVGLGLDAAGRAVVGVMTNGSRTFRRAISEWAEEGASSLLARGGSSADDVLEKLTGGGATPERLERIRAKFQAAGLETGSRGEVASVAAKEAKATATRQAELAEQLGARGVTPDAAGLRSTIDDAIEDLEASGSKDHTEAAARLRKLARSSPETLADATKLQSQIDDVATWARDKRQAALPEIEKLSARVSSQIDDAAATAGPTAQAIWKGAREEAADWKQVYKKLGSEKLTDTEARRVIGLAGTAVGLATGSVIPYLGAAALSHNPAVRQFVSERGGAGLAWLASKAGAVEKTIHSAAQRIAHGDPITALRTAIDSRDVASRAKSRASLRATAIHAGTVALTAAERQKHFTAVRDELNRVSSDPSVLMTRIRDTIAPLAAEQPEVAQAMARRVVADYGYLQSKMPATSTAIGQTLTPGADKPLVSKHEQEKLVRYAGALADPVATIEGIAGGEINWEGVDALKERRPELWQSFGARVALETAKRSEPLPYKQRVYLSLLFGFPTDPSMTPEGSAAIQDAAAYQPGGEAPQGPGRGAPSSLDAQAIGSTMATPAQQSGAMQ